MTADVQPRTCPHCGAAIHDGDAFCEACGEATESLGAEAVAPLVAADPAAGSASGAAAGIVAATSVLEAPHARVVTCAFCGGTISDDGFCDTCGTKARTWRDHWTEEPAPWVGAVCDRGIRHARNEDAMATAAGDGYAVLVVCDGVTSAPDSDQASLAAATEACDHLVGVARTVQRAGAVPAGNAANVEAAVRALNAGCRVAQVAVLGVTERLAAAAPGGHLAEPPSCTFVAALLTGRHLAVGWCGDSRAYWLGDDGVGLQLSTDHSLASELIAGGMTRAEAEHDPTAHTITRWLGADSADATPDTLTIDLTDAGWLLVCSDGLWNYASTPTELAALVARARADGAATPTAIAEALAAFANEQGGHDNITAVLARVEASSISPTSPLISEES